MIYDRGQPHDPYSEAYMEHVQIWRAESLAGQHLADLWTVMIGQLRMNPDKLGLWLVQLRETRWITGQCRAYTHEDQAIGVAQQVMAHLSTRDPDRTWQHTRLRPRRSNKWSSYRG